jgi:hypothetical protein
MTVLAFNRNRSCFCSEEPQVYSEAGKQLEPTANGGGSSPPPALGELAAEWKGLASVGQVVSITERDGKETSEVRFYISSLKASVKQFAAAVRGH